MRASFVAFVLLSVSAAPSLAAPLGEVQERAIGQPILKNAPSAGFLLKNRIRPITNDKRAAKAILKDLGKGLASGAGMGLLDDLTGSDSDDSQSQRRSLPAIGHFVADEAGRFLGGQAVDAVTGSDDNSRRSINGLAIPQSWRDASMFHGPGLAIPSTDYDSDDSQRRALPALIPDIIEIGGSIIGGLSNKNNRRALMTIPAHTYADGTYSFGAAPPTANDKRAIKSLVKNLGEGALKGAGEGLLDNLTGDDSDNSQRRSLPAIGHFVADEAGRFLGGQAVDAVTGSDDNSKRAISGLLKGLGRGALTGAGEGLLGDLIGDDSDNSQRRSLPVIGHFVADQAGRFLGGQAVDAVTGGDDNQRRAIAGLVKGLGRGALEGAGTSLFGDLTSSDSDN